MENVVLEIGTEEIPAQYMENALKNLNQLAQKYRNKSLWHPSKTNIIHFPH